MIAKILADSISNQGYRITTFEVRMHRFVLAEFNTHRALSRNSASSRAIPVAKQLERVRNDLAYPLAWPAEQKGMQGGDEVTDTVGAEMAWQWAAEKACEQVERLVELGVHKSITNRLLEPFMWHTVIATGDQFGWLNFFEQRCSPLAQPEIRAVAEAMRELYQPYQPQVLGDNQWHLPLIDDEDRQSVLGEVGFGPNLYHDSLEVLKKVSVARCARVSYLTHDGVRDLKQDLALYEKLVSADPPHWSPLEHVAIPWLKNVDTNVDLRFYDRFQHRGFKSHRPRIGNLVGWRSMRVEHEAVAV